MVRRDTVRPPSGPRPASNAALARGERPAGERRPHNLPHPLTSFVGREREIAEVRELLGRTRLLTLTGAGGVGKTRLGQEVATGLLEAFPDGVWLAELSALADPDLVPQAVASALGVREEPGRSLIATLATSLRRDELLLVLDNCEHLVEACAEVADILLRTCPELRILATSRQPLRIAGETTFRVPSLGLAAGESASTMRTSCKSLPPTAAHGEPTARSEAARLYVDRARAAVPGFVLHDRNAVTVEQICQRLDGIPLAIELAAARIEVLSPEQVAARLGDRFRFLSCGSRTALPRHQTLRALIDWSHDLLDERERVLLRRLAVFAGGWTLEAAEAVCDGGTRDEEGAGARDPGAMDAGAMDAGAMDAGAMNCAPTGSTSLVPLLSILDALAGLVAKSLVVTSERGDELRYGFLESLREYAGEKLREAGEEAMVRERHCSWLLAFAERAEAGLGGPDSIRWLDRLEPERENARAALGWCLERAEVEVGLRLAGALTRFWLVRGPYREIRDTLEELLGLPAAQDAGSPVRAARTKALLAAGRLAMRQGDHGVAERHFREALALSQQLGDRRSLGIARFSIGHVARVCGDYAAARAHHAEAIRLFEALADDHWLANTHHDLGLAAYFEGDLATAREHYDLTLALSERLGDELGIASALNDLGEVALLQGRLDEARALETDCLNTARRLDDKKMIGMALAALAGIAVAQGRPTRALRLAAAATALNEAAGQRHSPAWHAMVDRWLAPARRAMNVEASAAAEAAGRAMPLDEAIEYALSLDRSDDPAPVPATTTSTACAVGSTAPDPSAQLLASAAANGLTPREQEVAALVARGLTNRQIAAELVITRGTATNHVKHILARLGLDSRVQIAAWVVERRLVRRSSA